MKKILLLTAFILSFSMTTNAVAQNDYWARQKERKKSYDNPFDREKDAKSPFAEREQAKEDKYKSETYAKPTTELRNGLSNKKRSSESVMSDLITKRR